MTLRDKIIGTLVLPFGFVSSLLVLVNGLHQGESVSLADGSVPPPDEIRFDAPQAGTLSIVIALLPFVSAVYLLVRAWMLKRRP